MFMDFETFEKILSDLGWECSHTTTYTGEVKFFKGELESGWFAGGEPVVGMGVEDKKRQFRRSIIFSVPIGEMEANLTEWLSHVEMEYKLFGL